MDEKDYLEHFGVLGMKWGRRRRVSAANAADRDSADLRKHGYKKEATAVAKNAKKLRKEIKEIDKKLNSESVKENAKKGATLVTRSIGKIAGVLVTVYALDRGSRLARELITDIYLGR